DRSHTIVVRQRGSEWIERRLKRREPAGRARGPRVEPAGDVAAAGHGRQVVDMAQQVEVRQRLQYAQVEGRAADAAAGKAESDQICVRGPAQRGPGGRTLW